MHESSSHLQAVLAQLLGQGKRERLKARKKTSNLNDLRGRQGCRNQDFLHSVWTAASHQTEVLVLSPGDRGSCCRGTVDHKHLLVRPSILWSPLELGTAAA